MKVRRESKDNLQMRICLCGLGLLLNLEKLTRAKMHMISSHPVRSHVIKGIMGIQN